MPESVTEKYVESIPKGFQLPKGFDAPKEPAAPVAAPAAPEAKPAAEAPATPPPVDDLINKPDEVEKPEEETTGKDPEKPSTRRFERRIDRAIRAKAEAQTRADQLERELAEIKARQQTPDPGEPQASQYTDVEEYAKAKAKYAVDKSLREHEGKQKAEVQKKAEQRLLDNWQSQLIKASEKYEDFDEIVGDLKPDSPAAIAIMRAENGADVAFHLAKHPKEAQKFSDMDPYDQVLEIGRLSVRLSTPTPVKPKEPSKAPPPITPISGTANVLNGEIQPQMPFEEYKRIMDKKMGRTK